MRTLPSYFVKTLFMQYMHSKDEDFWEKDLSFIELALKELFTIMNFSVVNRECHNFFIPQMSVIDWKTIPKTTIEVISSQCIRISESPVHYLQEKTNSFHCQIVVPLVILNLGSKSKDDTVEQKLHSHLYNVLSKRFTISRDISRYEIDMKNFYHALTCYHSYLFSINYNGTEREKKTIKSIQKSFCNKMYAYMTNGTHCLYSRMEKFFIELGSKLPEHSDLFQYEGLAASSRYASFAKEM